MILGNIHNVNTTRVGELANKLSSRHVVICKNTSQFVSIATTPCLADTQYGIKMNTNKRCVKLWHMSRTLRLEIVARGRKWQLLFMGFGA